jgi:hypothetical protein
MMTKKKDKNSEANWSGAAKVGAAVGSAALVAALLYAGRRNLTHKKGKLEPQSPPAGTELATSPAKSKPAAKAKKKAAKAPKKAAAKIKSPTKN